MIGIVTQRQVQDVKILTDVDVSEYRNAITGGAIDHITKRHGAHGIADNSMRNDADIARIGYVLENYDSAELLKDENGNPILSTEWQNKDRTKAKMVKFAKKIDGTYYVVEAVPDSGKKTLRVVSAYLQKDSGSSTRLLNMGETPPQLTPKTPAGMATSAMGSLPQLVQTVNKGDSLAAYGDNALIYTVLVSLGVHETAAESLAKSYDPAEGISPEIYARGAAEAFFYGRGNFTETELRNGKGLSPVLTELQRSTAYRLGQIFQERQTTKEEAAIAQKKAAAKKSGSVAQSQKGNVYYDGDRSRLTERQRVSVRALEKLAQALGVDFYLYESERDAAGKPIGANGWYDQKTGDIHIDLNAGELGEGTILFTAAHELTHFLRQWSPSKFKVLSDFLVGQYGAKGQSVSDLVRNQQAKAKRNGRSLSWMQAYEEMVADSMETMLSDGTVIEKLTKLSAKDKGLAQKVLDWFKGFAAKLKRAYKDLSADSAEGRLVAEMTDTIDRLQTLFTEGLAQAGENYRAAERRKNSTSRNEHAEKHYSFRNSKTGMANDALQPYDAELRNLIESQGNIIVDSYEKLVEVVNRAFDNPKDKATAYFGILDTSILVRIEKSIQNLPEALKGMLFKQNKQYSVATTLDSIRHLTDNKSISRNDVMDYLDRLADTIAEFDTVAFDNYTDGMGKRNNGILFKKLFSDGVLQSFSIVSHKKRSIRLVTIYLESGAYQKKKSAKTLPMQNAPAHTLKAGVGQTSTNSISQLPQKNNLQNSTSSNNTSSFSELHSDRGNLTTRSVLMEMDTKQVKNDIAQKYLKMYQENVQLQYAEQKKLVDLQEKLDALPVDQRNTDRAHDLRNEANKVKNHIRVYESILTRLETDSPLTYLIAHEVEPRLAKAQETAMPQERENAARRRTSGFAAARNGSILQGVVKINRHK